MHPPSWVCCALYRQRPDLRLAWHGRPRSNDEETGDRLNAGDFAIVQLFPAKVVGPLSEPRIFSELWEVTPRLNEAGSLEMIKIDRGPVFNRFGGTTHDYDPITQVPIYVVNLGGLGFDKQRVSDGEFLKFIASWSRRASDRMKESMRAELKDAKNRVNEIAGEATDYWWHLASKTGETAPTVPWEFARKDVYRMYEKQQHRKLESYYKI